jgi:histone deacetylase complex regulatory component SIN3
MDESFLYAAFVIWCKVANRWDRMKQLKQLLVLSVDLLHEGAVYYQWSFKRNLYLVVLNEPPHLLVNVFFELFLKSIQRFGQFQIELHYQLQCFYLPLFEYKPEAKLRLQKRLFVVLHEFVSKLFVEDAFRSNHEASLSDLLLNAVYSFHLEKVLAGTEPLHRFLFSNVELPRIFLVPSINVSKLTYSSV